MTGSDGLIGAPEFGKIWRLASFPIVKSLFNFQCVDLADQRADGGLLRWIIPPLPLLEKDQYRRIQWLRSIAYHHNLHMWYEVVCIGGVGDIEVLLEVFLSGINEISFQFFFISLVPLHVRSPFSIIWP
jgi:hypothetical protein